MLSRRKFLAVAGSGALGLAACSPAMTAGGGNGRLLYAGTYTRGRSEGIYVLRMDTTTGAITTQSVAKGIANPSYLTLNAARDRLYAVEEVEDYGGQPAGAVTAFAVDAATGDLSKLNTVSSRGKAPCYVSLDRTGRFVLVANYNGGNAASFPIQADGSLGEAATVVQHQGSGPNPQRQEGPHAHFVQADPGNRFVVVSDLGLDRLMVYRFDATNGSLTPADPAYAALPPGSGPRHFTFGPDGNRAYVINELNSTLTAFRYQPGEGSLTATQTLSTLPPGHAGPHSCADLHVSADGRFVYGSNRGHDSIVVYSVGADGALSLIQHQGTMGRTPRNFTLDPSGRFLLVANQNSDNVVTFAVDAATGRLTPTDHVADVPVPVCLRFA